jgi:phosphoribosyl-ATP pyrophosphohydrolase
MKLNDLYEIICSRRDNPTYNSYTAGLFERGLDEMVKKVGEESVEVIIAAKGQGSQRLVEEISDLAYHTLVLMAASGIEPKQIEAELEKRHHK